jgi:hypothetical protein
MLRVIFPLLSSFLASAVSAQGDSIVGSWHLRITRGGIPLYARRIQHPRMGTYAHQAEVNETVYYL